MANVVLYFRDGKPSDNWIQCNLHKNNRFVNWVTGRCIEPDPVSVWAPMDIAFVMCFPSIAGFSKKIVPCQSSHSDDNGCKKIKKAVGL